MTNVERKLLQAKLRSARTPSDYAALAQVVRRADHPTRKQFTVDERHERTVERDEAAEDVSAYRAFAVVCIAVAVVFLLLAIFEPIFRTLTIIATIAFGFIGVGFERSAAASAKIVADFSQDFPE